MSIVEPFIDHNGSIFKSEWWRFGVNDVDVRSKVVVFDNEETLTEVGDGIKCRTAKCTHTDSESVTDTVISMVNGFEECIEVSTTEGEVSGISIGIEMGRNGGE